MAFLLTSALTVICSPFLEETPPCLAEQDHHAHVSVHSVALLRPVYMDVVNALNERLEATGRFAFP